jgi:altronate dehydratase small subunit
MSATAKIWVIHRDDNVGTVVGGDAGVGADVAVAGVVQGSLALIEPVPYGHKVALRELAAGEAVVKYGVVVGSMTRAVAAGGHVHVHNAESLRGRGDLDR